MPKEGSPCDLGGRAQKLGKKREKRGTEEDFSAGISTGNIKCCYQKTTANYTIEAKAP